MARRPEYQSLTLTRAIGKGWAYKQGLQTSDVTVLQFIASWGTINQPGASFAWFPAGSMDEWAESMGLQRRTLFRSIKRLTELGHLEARQGVDQWTGKTGYGIPVETMHGCDAWAKRPISDASKVSSQSQDNDVYSPQQSVTAVTHTVSPLSLMSVTGVTQAPPLTWGNEAHNQGKETREVETHPLTRVPAKPELIASEGSSPFGGRLTSDSGEVQSTSPTGGPTVYDEDDWTDQPKDFAEDLAFSRPKPVKPKRNPAITNVLAGHFYTGWTKARENRQYMNMQVPFTNKAGFQANLKRYLEVDSPEVVKASMDAFWTLVVAGQIRLGGKEMWLDFHNSRDQSRSLALSNMTTSTYDAEAEAAHNARIIAEANDLAKRTG